MKNRTSFVYVVVAAVCFSLHNAVLILSDFASAPLWGGVLLSFFIVAGAGYVLHGIFTFRQPLAAMAFARYSVAMLANIPLAYVATWLWHIFVGLPMPIAAPLASMCMLVVNFLLARLTIVAPIRKIAS